MGSVLYTTEPTCREALRQLGRVEVLLLMITSVIGGWMRMQIWWVLQEGEVSVSEYLYHLLTPKVDRHCSQKYLLGK
jgi:hypothetical protein